MLILITISDCYDMDVGDVFDVSMVYAVCRQVRSVCGNTAITLALQQEQFCLTSTPDKNSGPF
jgi:hypothetical protein